MKNFTKHMTFCSGKREPKAPVRIFNYSIPEHVYKNIPIGNKVGKYIVGTDNNFKKILILDNLMEIL